MINKTITQNEVDDGISGNLILKCVQRKLDITETFCNFSRSSALFKS